ncbi:TatD family hydrolase [Fulvivirga sp. 29W222]|uniref:TatD family hydrolase n=1 Tax=Fulvivirga marina TaxID=2494733 RepID=A0A937KFJ8_9BACT|nr:TatD family hydrolase [Fulvivirga marina]MBL6448263.1 TatD family hydrolase [Fulvivirga marina]
MSKLLFNRPVTLDFHTHKVRHQDNPNIVEIVSLHLGKDDPPEGPYTVGKHPWWTEDILSPDEANEMKAHFGSTNCVALGEMGLDNLKGPSMQVQMDILRSQLQVADELNAAVIIHCVRAYHQLLQVKGEFPSIKNWCIHGYGRNVTLALQLIDAGFYISLMPQPHKPEKFSELLHAIPANRIFLETDSMPDVSIENIYLQASNALGISIEKLKDQFTNNANTFFDYELAGKNRTVNW